MRETLRRWDWVSLLYNTILESIPDIFGICHSSKYLSGEMRDAAFSSWLTLIMSDPFSTRMTALMGNSSHCQHARRCKEGRVDEWDSVIKKEMMDDKSRLFGLSGGWGWNGSWSVAWHSLTHCLWGMFFDVHQQTETSLPYSSLCTPPYAIETAWYIGKVLSAQLNLNLIYTTFNLCNSIFTYKVWS